MQTTEELRDYELDLRKKILFYRKCQEEVKRRNPVTTKYQSDIDSIAHRLTVVSAEVRRRR